MDYLLDLLIYLVYIWISIYMIQVFLSCDYMIPVVVHFGWFSYLIFNTTLLLFGERSWHLS